MSHPKTRFSNFPFSCSSKSPFTSMVWYEIHFRASTTRLATIAFVGHASIQRVQFPQWSLTIFLLSYGNSMSRTSSPIKKKLPCSTEIKLLFLPTQPKPARRAQARSRTGAESTNGRPVAWNHFLDKFASSLFNLSFITK